MKLKFELVQQEKALAKEIFELLSEIRKLANICPDTSELTTAEIFSKTELNKRKISTLILMKERVIFQIDLINKCRGRSHNLVLDNDYPLFHSTIIHYN